MLDASDLHNGAWSLRAAMTCKGMGGKVSAVHCRQDATS